jgi:hypothetical protein
VVFAVPLDLFVLFESLSGAARSKKARNGFMLIWDVKLWVIWRTRNEKMFANGDFEVKVSVDMKSRSFEAIEDGSSDML